MAFFSFSLGVGICLSMEEARNSGRVIAGAHRSMGIDTSCLASLALAGAWGINFPLESLCPSRRFLQYFCTPSEPLCGPSWEASQHKKNEKIKKINTGIGQHRFGQTHSLCRERLKHTLQEHTGSYRPEHAGQVSMPIRMLGKLSAACLWGEGSTPW